MLPTFTKKLKNKFNALSPFFLSVHSFYIAIKGAIFPQNHFRGAGVFKEKITGVG